MYSGGTPLARFCSRDSHVLHGTMRSPALEDISAPSAPVTSARRSDRDLPSRTADDLFWLGRYLERCEGAVRAYRCLFSHVAEGNSEDQKRLVRTVPSGLTSRSIATRNASPRRMSRVKSTFQANTSARSYTYSWNSPSPSRST